MQILQRESRNASQCSHGQTFHAATFSQVGSGTLVSTMRFFQNWRECYLDSMGTGLRYLKLRSAKVNFFYKRCIEIDTCYKQHSCSSHSVGSNRTQRENYKRENGSDEITSGAISLRCLLVLLHHGAGLCPNKTTRRYLGMAG